MKRRIKVSEEAEEGARGLLLTARGVVRPSHCDHMGHMNVMWYTGRFDEATWHLFHHIGITPSYMRKNQRGMAGVQQDTTYKQELFAGDLDHNPVKNSGNARKGDSFLSRDAE